jgi:hypothetical protein
MICRVETVRRIDQSTSVINFMGCARHVELSGRENCFLVLDTVRPLRAEVFFLIVGTKTSRMTFTEVVASAPHTHYPFLLR